MGWDRMAKKEPAIVKRDTRENWLKSKYIPKENVIVVMDNSNGSVSLMIGDGETNVNELPDLLQADVQGAKAVVNDVLML